METKKELLAIVSFVGFTILISGIFLFYGGGIDNPDNLAKFQMYGLFSITGAGALIAFRTLAPNKGVYKVLNMAGFHEPRGSLFENISFIKDIKLWIFLSLIACIILGLFSGVTGSFYTNLPEFQVTETAELGLSVEPAVSGETLFFNGFVFYFSAFVVAWTLKSRFGAKTKTAITIALVMAILIATSFFVAYHNYRYASEETSVTGIIFLALVTNSFVALTGSLVFPYLFHAFGNMYQKAFGMFSSEFVVANTILALIALILFYYLFILRDDIWTRG